MDKNQRDGYLSIAENVINGKNLPSAKGKVNDIPTMKIII